MKEALYFMVASKEQSITPEQKALISNAKEYKTILLYPDGTTKELSAEEIRNIFKSYLNRNCDVHIEKPKKKFNYIGKLK